MTSFRQRKGAFLLKTPDLVLPDLDAPRSFSIVDINHQDCSRSSTCLLLLRQYDRSKSALHRHRALEIAGPRDYFGTIPEPPPWRLHESSHICNFNLWFLGQALGAQAQAIIKDIGSIYAPISLCLLRLRS